MLLWLTSSAGPTRLLNIHSANPSKHECRCNCDPNISRSWRIGKPGTDLASFERDWLRHVAPIGHG